MFTARLILSLVLIWNLTPANGCSCWMPDTHKQFCAADFVTWARIKTVSEDAERQAIVYGLLKITHYKETEAFKNSTKNKGRTFSVKTDGHEATCGIKLGAVGDSILVSGHVDSDGEIWTSLCDWNTKFTDLPMKTLKELFYGSYSDSCK